jgi:hypothetical protein
LGSRVSPRVFIGDASADALENVIKKLREGDLFGSNVSIYIEHPHGSFGWIEFSNIKGFDVYSSRFSVFDKIPKNNKNFGFLFK